MSHIMYDFLTESFLYYESNLETSYSKYTKQIEDELLKYREYILKHIDDIINEIKDGHDNTTAFFQMCNSKLIGIDILKQCGLYMHKFILDDPVFKFASDINISECSIVMNTYLGLSSSKDLDNVSLKI